VKKHKRHKREGREPGSLLCRLCLFAATLPYSFFFAFTDDAVR
jgi:hypothetical protein